MYFLQENKSDKWKIGTNYNSILTIIESFFASLKSQYVQIKVMFEEMLLLAEDLTALNHDATDFIRHKYSSAETSRLQETSITQAFLRTNKHLLQAPSRPRLQHYPSKKQQETKEQHLLLETHKRQICLET